ncbi:hypothetical protein OSB04_un000369 [Centaurea solstitialis]|uniref:Secreted protein n=1 Tax=Centaurea solstitialis TaxID=347529 RepID=A0AA38SI87_9ASTR|nr:hypothetical protein OSB04_un000369 [Centaurea solstitialis]
MASATAVAVALAAAVIARPPVTTMVVVFAIVVADDGDVGAPTGDDNGGCFPGFYSPIGALSRGLEHIGAPPWGIEVVVGTPPGAAVAVSQEIRSTRNTQRTVECPEKYILPQRIVQHNESHLLDYKKVIDFNQEMWCLKTCLNLRVKKFTEDGITHTNISLFYIPTNILMN